MQTNSFSSSLLSDAPRRRFSLDDADRETRSSYLSAVDVKLACAVTTASGSLTITCARYGRLGTNSCHFLCRKPDLLLHNQMRLLRTLHCQDSRATSRLHSHSPTVSLSRVGHAVQMLYKLRTINNTPRHDPVDVAYKSV